MTFTSLLDHADSAFLHSQRVEKGQRNDRSDVESDLEVFPKPPLIHNYWITHSSCVMTQSVELKIKATPCRRYLMGLALTAKSHFIPLFYTHPPLFGLRIFNVNEQIRSNSYFLKPDRNSFE